MISLFGPPEPTLLEKLKTSVSKTKNVLAETVDTIFQGERAIDPALLKKLETALLSADLGVAPTREILDSVKEKLDRHALSNGEELKREIKSHIVRILIEPRSTDMWRQAADRERDAFFGAAGQAAAAQGGGLRPSVVSGGGSGPSVSSSAGVKVSDPRVIFVVGVNGVGKTTSIGKLANRLKKQGLDVVLCAADTFRAAAIEQLEIWAQRNGVEVIKQKSGSDPAAVVFDALAAAKARAADAVIVDTAGRLHTKTNLMAELEKMKRTASKVIPGAPHDILLVMDATTGQNGLSQAREFTASVGVTGIILTKLDGTAKGGIVVAIARELRLPIRFIGTGEQINDMVPFDAQTYADSLFN
jgi:fused signal recognition particle receptor